MNTAILKRSPVGWWYQDDRGGGSWVGPFPTDQEALEMARHLVPDIQKEIKLLHVTASEQKTAPAIEGR